MTLPNFLIIGAAKSGTTSLHQYLRQHPDLFLPEVKEASYFADTPRFNDLGEYLALFADAGAINMVGEASTAYLFDPLAPVRAREKLGPDVRIIAILRNPVDMAYSLWGHMWRNAFEDLPFFEAIAAADKRLADPRFLARRDVWAWNFAYVARARYADQIARWRDTFGQDQVKVLVFEEMFDDLEHAMGDVCDFLGVRSDVSFDLSRHNEAGVSRSRTLQRLAHSPRLRDLLRPLLPPSLRIAAYRLLDRVNRRRQAHPKLTEAERQACWAYFADDVARLEALLGRPLAPLWQSRAGAEVARA